MDKCYVGFLAVVVKEPDCYLPLMQLERAGRKPFLLGFRPQFYKLLR